MRRRRSLLSLALVAVVTLSTGAYLGHLGTAQADPPSSSTAVAPASPRGSDETPPDVKVDPARENAVPCNCTGMGSGCGGACPNAPGPKRRCKNIAPPGKPKMCACV